MAHPALQVTSGDTLQMQFVADNDTTRPRLTVSVIGQINGRSLLVSHPSTGGRLLLVRDGQPVACRMFSDGRMLGFRTTVRKVVTHPDAYLHLDYPRTLEQRVLRRAPRVPVELAGRIRCINSTSSHAAHIEDISLRGCRVTALQTTLNIGDAIELTAPVQIGVHDHELRLPGIVRNTVDTDRDRSRPDARTYGVEFKPSRSSDELLIRGLIYEQLHGDTEQPAAASPRPVLSDESARTRIPMSA